MLELLNKSELTELCTKIEKNFNKEDWASKMQSLKKKNTRFEKNISMDQISVAVALEYTKYRFTDSWSNDCTKLNEWLSEFNSNDFMELTIPKEAT